MNQTVSASKPSIASLTGIRGFAALWVVFYHLRPAFAQLLSNVNGNYFLQLINQGYLGVDLFAFLSGFIICYTYTSSLCRFNFSTALRFIWLRFGRIYPLHLFALFLFVIMYCNKNGLSALNTLFSDMAFVRQLLLFNGSGLETRWAWNVPSWSLSSEWLCYLLFPLFLPFIAKITSGYLALIFAISSFVITAVLLNYLGYVAFNTALSGGFIRIFGEIIVGCFLYRTYVSRVFNHLPFSLISFLMLIVIFTTVISHPIIAISAFAILIFSLSQTTEITSVVFGNRFCVYFGEISFSIYMIHWFIIDNAAYWGLTKIALPILIPLLLIIIISLSALTYEFIEKPSRSYLRKLAS